MAEKHLWVCDECGARLETDGNWEMPKGWFGWRPGSGIAKSKLLCPRHKVVEWWERTTTTDQNHQWAEWQAEDNRTRRYAYRILTDGEKAPEPMVAKRGTFTTVTTSNAQSGNWMAP